MFDIALADEPACDLGEQDRTAAAHDL